MTTYQTPLTALALLTICVAAVNTARAEKPWQCNSVESCYNLLKGFDESAANRAPNPTKELKLGRLDVATGAFFATELPVGPEHVIRGKIETPREGNHIGKPVRDPDETYNDPAVIDAVTVVFTVELVHHGAQAVTLACNGRKVAAKKGAASVSCSVGAKESALAWKLTAGGHTGQGGYAFKRAPFITMGAFIIPAVPLGVLYEPPQNKAKGTTQSSHGCTSNCAAISVAQRVGSTVGLTLSSSDSVTTDGTLGDASADTWSTVADVARGLGAVAAVIPAPYGPIISAALNLFAAGLGHAEAHDTKSTQRLSQKTWSFAVTSANGITTGEGLGPGLGDVILYQHNVRVAWIGSNQGAFLALIPNPDGTYGSFAQHSVRELIADRTELSQQLDRPTPAACVKDMTDKLPAGCGSRTGADLKTIEALLRLDPFVGKDFQVSSNADLDPKRFAWTPSITLNGGEQDFSIEHDIESADTSAVTQFQNATQQASKGFLSIAGYGPDENRTVVSNTTHTVSKTRTVGSSVTATLELFAEADEVCTFDVFYDRVFGTFVFKKDPSTEDKVSGTALDSAGRPRKFQKVKLTAANGRTFITKTDANGNFRFRSSHLESGAVMVTVEGVTPTRAQLTPSKLKMIVK